LKAQDTGAWGIRILCGPDAFWFGDEDGAFTFSRFQAERIAVVMNARSNAVFRITLAMDMPHYRYAATPMRAGNSARTSPAAPAPGGRPIAKKPALLPPHAKKR
jgi:hypothetical protein